MATPELTINFNLTYLDADGVNAVVELVDALQTVTTQRPHLFTQAITTSEVALNLGPLASLGWAGFVNLDPTNFIELRVGTGSTKFAKLWPGKGALFYFGSGITAPYAIADTATCKLFGLICAP